MNKRIPYVEDKGYTFACTMHLMITFTMHMKQDKVMKTIAYILLEDLIGIRKNS